MKHRKIGQPPEIMKLAKEAARRNSPSQYPKWQERRKHLIFEFDEHDKLIRD